MEPRTYVVHYRSPDLLRSVAPSCAGTTGLPRRACGCTAIPRSTLVRAWATHQSRSCSRGWRERTGLDGGAASVGTGYGSAIGVACVRGRLLFCSVSSGVPGWEMGAVRGAERGRDGARAQEADEFQGVMERRSLASPRDANQSCRRPSAAPAIPPPHQLTPRAEGETLTPSLQAGLSVLARSGVHVPRRAQSLDLGASYGVLTPTDSLSVTPSPRAPELDVHRTARAAGSLVRPSASRHLPARHCRHCLRGPRRTTDPTHSCDSGHVCMYGRRVERVAAA